MQGSQGTLACNRAKVASRRCLDSGMCPSPFSQGSCQGSQASSRSSSEAPPMLRSLADARCARKMGMASEKVDGVCSISLQRRSLAEARLAQKEQISAQERSARFNEDLLAKLDLQNGKQLRVSRSLGSAAGRAPQRIR